MIAKIISPKWHAFIDYLLAGSILVIPSVLKLNKTAKKIYTAEGLILLPYVALTGQPVALEGIIPWEVHQKIDPFNIAQFAYNPLQNLFAGIKKHYYLICPLSQLLQPLCF
jgi:hypothetical protein